MKIKKFNNFLTESLTLNDVRNNLTELTFDAGWSNKRLTYRVENISKYEFRNNGDLVLYLELEQNDQIGRNVKIIVGDKMDYIFMYHNDGKTIDCNILSNTKSWLLAVRKNLEKINELSGNIYKSVMNKVSDKGDPRSFRLYSDAKKLRSKYYTKEPLNILVDGIPFKFEIMDIRFDGKVLSLISKDDQSRDIYLTLDINDKDFLFNGKNTYINRKGAIILSKILKDYEIEVRPQDIPQL